MLEPKIKAIIKQGEGVRIEFKECKTALNKDVYETVCAFLNRSGGELLLGVRADGVITGIAPDIIHQIKNDFTTAVNNPQKISPSFYLSLDEVVIDGKTILYIYLPESSQVHRCNGKIYDRNEDGDFNITDNNNLVAALFLRKQTSYSENSNKPHGHGLINPADFSPFPKNPSIAKVFKEIGRADELGSGVRKLFKYGKIYSGADPRLLEEDVFKVIIPLTPQATMQATEQATEQVTEQADRTAKILEFCRTEKSTSEIMDFLGLAHREHFRSEILNPLLEQGLLHPTIPDKLTSPKQKYYSAKK